MAKRCKDKISRIEFRGLTLEPSKADYGSQLAQLRMKLESGELQPDRVEETIPDTASGQEVADDLFPLFSVWERPTVDDRRPL